MVSKAGMFGFVGRQSCAPAGGPTVRVLLIAPYAPLGGGMGRIMAYLAGCGPQAGVTFEMVESRGGGSALASIWHVLRAARRILLVSISVTPAIVHLNFGEGGSVARKGLLLMLADLVGLPTVIHLHAAEIVEFHAALPQMFQALMAWVFQRARICVVLGPSWQRWLVDQLGVPPCRIMVVRNGVPQPEVEPGYRRADQFTVVFLGNLLARKGVPDLLHALATLPSDMDRRAPSWRLLVAGGGDRTALQGLASVLGILHAVDFLGWQSRPATIQILQRAHVVVLPSYHEALPLVLLEAASLGVPLIATRVGAVPDVFTDGHDAILLQPGDRAALRDALSRLMVDPALAERLGNNARGLYEREFTMPVFVGRMAELYTQLVGAAG